MDFEVLDREDVELEVRFKHSSTLWGRVLSGGQGVGRETVFLRHVESPSRALTDFTEDDGTYSFGGLADGPHEVVVLGNRFHVDVHGDTELDLALAAFSISGIVRANGHPWPTVRIFARPLDAIDGETWRTIWAQRGGPYVIQTVTGADGNYRLEGLPEGRYEIIAQAPYFDGGNREVFVNAAVEGVDLHLRPTEDLRQLQVLPSPNVTAKRFG